ncbi:MAG: hypothetical protein PF444_00545 [Bacteroidales bacterium]|jgi:SanA protein|nr:hypothetical protein [Bacteroidales bacterium]
MSHTSKWDAFSTHGNTSPIAINRYYTYRINAAIDLYTSGRIEYMLASGDHSNKDNAPSSIKEDLIAEGITAESIYLDHV